MNTRVQLQTGRIGLPPLAILFGVALFSFGIFAAPPNAPVFTALDEEELNPPNTDGRYSLDDATRGLPFTLNTPTPPQIVAEQVVTPSTLGNYISTPGIRLILEPGNYGSLAISGRDKEIVLTTGVIVNELNVYGQRIVVRADPMRTGTINTFAVNDGAADVMFNGIYTDSTSVGSERNLLWRCDRVAILNSRLRTNDFVLGSFPQSPGGPSNVIVGNTSLESYGGVQAAFRLQSVNGLAFVDNRLLSSGGNATFRLHTAPNGQKSDNLYVGRNQFEGNFWQVRPVATGVDDPNNTLGMGSVWLEDNNVYFNGLWWINMGHSSNNDFPEVFTQRNNNAFIASGGWRAADAYPWTATIENNTARAHTAPPAWEHQ